MVWWWAAVLAPQATLCPTMRWIHGFSSHNIILGLPYPSHGKDSLHWMQRSLISPNELCHRDHPWILPWPNLSLVLESSSSCRSNCRALLKFNVDLSTSNSLVTWIVRIIMNSASTMSKQVSMHYVLKCKTIKQSMVETIQGHKLK